MFASRESQPRVCVLVRVCSLQTGTTLLRWKPDWEGAAVAYREAVKMYKISGDTTGTIQGQPPKECRVRRGGKTAT